MGHNGGGSVLHSWVGFRINSTTAKQGRASRGKQAQGNKHLDMARGDKGTGRTPSMQWTGGQGSSQGGERLAPGIVHCGCMRRMDAQRGTQSRGEGEKEDAPGPRAGIPSAHFPRLTHPQASSMWTGL